MELLSPAGDFETLKTAVRCGADAVYIGGKTFSARANAQNFTNEELALAVDFCHIHRVKVYVALNITMKEEEFEDALRFASYLVEIGADGIIVQDLGLLCAIRKLSPAVQINASTQMTICSSDGVNLLKQLGANRVVLARELSESEIASIRKHTDLELEVFVHGAMCMSWSGQCLLSSVIGGRSGNRGLCAQPCRLPYTLLKNGRAVTNEKNLLCMKDLCLAEKMERVAAVADSAKIEGRMKSPEYAGVVTKVYKRAIEGTVNKEEIQNMLSFFSRGGSASGYFDGRGFRSLMDYDSKGKVTVSKGQLLEIQKTQMAQKRRISFLLTAKEDMPLLLQATCDGFSVAVQGAVCEHAKNAPFDHARAKAQLEKLGDTPFAPAQIETKTKGRPFVSVSALNELRRQACRQMEAAICASYRRKAKNVTVLSKKAVFAPTPPALRVQVRTKAQMEAAAESGIDAQYLSYELYQQYARKQDVCILPPLTKEGETLYIKNANRVMVQNLGQFTAAAGKELCGGERLNVTNCETIRVLADLGVRQVTLSPELNLHELSLLCGASCLPTEIIVYGRLPVMLMENCVMKSAYRCTKGEGNFELQDRKGERFALVCEGCRNVLLNSVPIYMADKLNDVINVHPAAIRLMFTTESKEQCKKVISAYQAAMNGKQPGILFDRITRGHFYRGVE